MTTASATGQKLWNHAGVPRDAGLSYGDHLEQLEEIGADLKATWSGERR